MKLIILRRGHAVTGSCHCLEVNGKRSSSTAAFSGAGTSTMKKCAGFRAQLHRLRHCDPRPTSTTPAGSPAGEGGAFRYRSSPPVLTLSADVGHAAGLRLHPGERCEEWQNQRRARRLPEAAGGASVHRGRRRGRSLPSSSSRRNTVRSWTCATGCASASGTRATCWAPPWWRSWATEGDVTKSWSFPADLGNIDQPIIRNPEFLDEADCVVMESTYGDRNHEIPEASGSPWPSSSTTPLPGRQRHHPSFAVGRTQELLYFLREIKHQGLVKSFPPSGSVWTALWRRRPPGIYAGDLRGYLDEEAIAVLQGEKSVHLPRPDPGAVHPTSPRR